MTRQLAVSIIQVLLQHFTVSDLLYLMYEGLAQTDSEAARNFRLQHIPVGFTPEAFRDLAYMPLPPDASIEVSKIPSP